MFAIWYNDHKRNTKVVIVEAKNRGEARQIISNNKDIKTIGAILEVDDK